jgi:DNA-binding PadR family transcriptional regulator
MTDAELTILSIIAEGPIYGFDLQTIINQRGLRAWTNIGVSSMYYVLQKLERQGLIESISGNEERGTSRREYRITPAGFGVLQTAVADLISTPREYADGFELGLANLYVLSPSQIRTAFTSYRQELSSRLAQARERWQQLKDSQAPFNVDAMFGHRVAMLETELDWIRTFIEQWEAQAPPEEPLPLPDPAEIPRMKQVVLPHDPDSPHRVPTRPLQQVHDHSEATETEIDTRIELENSSKATRISSKTPLELSETSRPPENDTPNMDDGNAEGDDDPLDGG